MNLFGTTANTESIEALRKLDVFRDLTFTETLEVDELLHERNYEKGEIIFEKGDIGHGIFVVVSGKVHVEDQDNLLNGAVLEFGPGEMLGELSLFEDAPRIATVRASEPTVMVALFRAEFSSLLVKNTKIGVKILTKLSKIMCARVRGLLLRQRRLPSV